MLIYSICFSPSDLLHSVWQSLGLFTSLQMTQFHSFLWLSDIPWHICTTFLHPFFYWCTFKVSDVKSLSRVRLLATPWTVAYQAPPSMGFSRQDCWSGLPFPSPGDLPDPGIEPGSPTLQADTLPSELNVSFHSWIMWPWTSYLI